MVEKVTRYLTRHGTLCNSQDEAELLEAKQDLLAYVDENPIFGNSAGCKVDGKSLWFWLEENPRAHFILLPEPKDES